MNVNEQFYLTGWDDIIVLNPEETARLDYENNWSDIVTFEGYLSIKAQQSAFENNEKGYQVNSTR